MRTAAVILDGIVPTFEVENHGMFYDDKDIIKAMVEYAKEVAIDFAKWCDKGRLHSNRRTWKR